MKASELRIGVSYLFWAGNTVVQFNGTHIYGDGQFGMSNHKTMPQVRYGGYEYYQVAWEDLKPIQLTPEILKAVGFEYVPEGLLYADKHHCIYEGGKNSGEPWKFQPFCTMDTDCTVSLQYLHQLQNLIFALTGQELEININLLK